ncbi:MAG: YfhO family protein, partial [Planctomycetia bacterium]|nr:YfhO family protein [Planctomycetia bacterium]
GLERGIANRSAWLVLGAGVALAMLGLGTHPQWAFYAGVFALVWTFPSERIHIARWVVCWAGAVAVAVMLAAVQLLPTWEASQWSARSSGVEATGTLIIGPRTALALLGPSYSYSPPQSWEMQGVFGFFWLTAACAAPLLSRPRVKWQFGVFVALVVFSIGGAALIEWLPGFNLFRVPTRMLLVAAFPLAFLVGVTTDALTRSAWGLEERGAVSRGFRRALLVVGVPTILGLRFFSEGPVWSAFIVTWVAFLVMMPLFIRVLQNRGPSPRMRTALWVVILLVDLLAPIAALPTTRPQAELYPTSPALDYLIAQPHRELLRVMDYDLGHPEERASFLGIGAPMSMVHGVPTTRGYNPLDVRHYREYLAFTVNDSVPVRGNSPYTQQVIPNIRFDLGNPQLFKMLGVTHRIAPTDAPPLPGEWKTQLIDFEPPAPPPLLPDSPRTLPPHALNEAIQPQPRAWIVPRAERWGGYELETLKACDFSKTVLILSEQPLSHPPGERPGAARIADYRPNRVVIELDSSGGWLVLTEVWYPGWKCFVDGAEVPVYRANHAFRAVPVPAGAKQAEFRFEPLSYRIGWWVSLCSACVVVLLGVWKAALHDKYKKNAANLTG